MLNYNITLSVQKLASPFNAFFATKIPKKLMAEGVGFEPTARVKRVTGFQDQLLKPLGHPSAYFQFYFFLRARFIIKHLIIYVNNPRGIKNFKVLENLKSQICYLFNIL